MLIREIKHSISLLLWLHFRAIDTGIGTMDERVSEYAKSFNIYLNSYILW